MGSDLTRLIRTSEQQSYNRCKWAWDLSYNKKLRQKRPGPVLRFGTIVHEALAAYYIPGRKRGEHPAKAFIKAYEKDVAEAGEFVIRGIDSETDEAKWEDARELGVDMLTAYVETYRGDPDWEVVATEQAFQAPVRHPRTGRVLFEMVGILDLIMRQRSTGRIWVWDHKTTDSINRWLKTLSLNPQASNYWTFGAPWMREQGIISPRVYNDLSGLMFNFLRRARQDERPRNALGQYLNKDGSVSKKQPATYFHREPTYRSDYDKGETLRRALNTNREMEMVKDGRLATVKSPNTMICAGCGWYDVCELHEYGQDWHLLLDAITEEWDPYEAHEIRDDELR